MTAHDGLTDAEREAVESAAVAVNGHFPDDLLEVVARIKADATARAVATYTRPPEKVVADLMGTLDTRVACQRGAKGLTTRQAAAQIGISHGRYNEIENGATNLSVRTLQHILRWLAGPEHPVNPTDQEPTR